MEETLTRIRSAEQTRPTIEDHHGTSIADAHHTQKMVQHQAHQAPSYKKPNIERHHSAEDIELTPLIDHNQVQDSNGGASTVQNHCLGRAASPHRRPLRHVSIAEDHSEPPSRSVSAVGRERGCWGHCGGIWDKFGPSIIAGSAGMAGAGITAGVTGAYIKQSANAAQRSAEEAKRSADAAWATRQQGTNSTQPQGALAGGKNGSSGSYGSG